MSNLGKFLRDKEWAMGNGQCPECCGVNESWLGHPLYLKSEKIGHKKNCAIAAALLDYGEGPLMQGDMKNEGEFEIFVSDEGFLATRHKAQSICAL